MKRKTYQRVPGIVSVAWSMIIQGLQLNFEGLGSINSLTFNLNNCPNCDRFHSAVIVWSVRGFPGRPGRPGRPRRPGRPVLENPENQKN